MRLNDPKRPIAFANGSWKGAILRHNSAVTGRLCRITHISFVGVASFDLRKVDICTVLGERAHGASMARLAPASAKQELLSTLLTHSRWKERFQPLDRYRE